MAARQVVALVHEERGAFGISFPDFPGCISGGRDLDEAVAKGGAALAFHVAGMLEDGEALPAIRSLAELRRDPAFRADAEEAVIAAVPLDLPSRSVRINISIEETLLQQVDRAAARRNQSRSAFLADAARLSVREG